MPLSPATAYRLGLVAQTLTDAAPEGLTLRAIARRTRLGAPALADVVRLCVERAHAQQRGRRYYAA